MFENFNITSFAHARVYSDKSATIILDSAKLEEEWYQQECSTRIYLGDNIYLCAQPSDNSKHLAKRKHRSPRLYIIQENCTHTDIYFLDTKQHTKKIIVHYLNTVDNIQQFLTQYQQQTQALIQAATGANKPYLKSNSVLPTPATVLPTIRDIFKSPHKFLTLYIGQASRPIKLSLNERLCLVGLIQGLTVQELSIITDLSMRTIEKYVSQLKQKFKCKKLAQLTYFLGKINIDLVGTAKP